jgi:hypothetical protein
LKHYRNKKVSSRQAAQDIIEAMLKRDHMSGERWDIDAYSINSVDEDSSGNEKAHDGLYYTVKQATWDLGLERHLRCVFSQGQYGSFRALAILLYTAG